MSDRSALRSSQYLKKLAIEDLFINECLMAEDVVIQVNSLLNKVDLVFSSSQNLFVYKSLKVCLKLAYLCKYSPCQISQMLTYFMKSLDTKDCKTVLQQVNDEVSKLRTLSNKHAALYGLYTKRSAIKEEFQILFENSSLKDKKQTVQFLVTLDHQSLLEIDTKISNLVEELQITDSSTPNYFNISIESLIDIDIWEIQAIHSIWKKSIR